MNSTRHDLCAVGRCVSLTRTKHNPTMTTTNDIALSVNVVVAPHRSSTTPATAGPTARAVVKPTELRRTPWSSCSGGRSTAAIDWADEYWNPAPRLPTPTMPMMSHGVSASDAAKYTSTNAERSWITFAHISTRRRLNRSDNVPDTGLMSSDGMSAATEPKPTQLFDLVSS